VPVIGLVQVSPQALADRYAYVSMIGISIMIAWGVPDLIPQKQPATRKQKNLDQTDHSITPVAFVTLAAIIAFTICTYRQIGYWHDDIKLFSHAVRVVPNNFLAYNNLGTGFFNQHNERAAERYFHESLRICPQFRDAQQNLTSLLYMQGRYDEAVTCLHTTLKMYPNDDLACIQLGAIYLQQAKLDLAEKYLRKAVRICPGNAKAHEILSVVLVKKGKLVRQ
jgi:tetratricopeptide (TPR) repeat protein